MQTFRIIRLSEVLESRTTEETLWWLSTFHCEKNADIERFLVKNAIRFEQAKLARTYLLLDEKSIILAYFTLSFKSIRVKPSKTQMKKLTGGLPETDQINTFLIAQIGKNTDVMNNFISLKMILAGAFEQLLIAQRVIGGRVAILECESNAKLMQLYENHGFRSIDTIEDASRLKTMFIIPRLE